VKREAAKAGHNERTLHRARKSLRVLSETVPGVVPRQTLWCLPVYDKSPWGDGITVITDINAGQGVSAPEGGTTSRDSYDSYDTPPREVAQTPLTTCAVCGEPMRPVTPDQTTHPLCEPSPAAVPSSESLDGKGSTRPDESPRWEQLLDDSTETPPHCPGEQAS
jgi:hypothetical protein